MSTLLRRRLQPLPPLPEVSSLRVVASATRTLRAHPRHRGNTLPRLSKLQDVRMPRPTVPTGFSLKSGCEYESDMCDLIALFDHDEQSAGRAQNERLIAVVQVLGGSGSAYRRERARTARAIIAEMYSPPRATASARRWPKYGLEAGLALDLTINDDTGKP